MTPKDAYPYPSSPAASAVMRANRKTNTSPELSLRRALHDRGYRYRVHYPISAAGLTVRPDIVFTKRRVAVFVDGCFWHGCPDHGNVPTTNPGYWGPKLERNKRRDTETTRALVHTGWTVARVWEHTPPKDAVRVVAAALDDRSGCTNHSALSIRG